MISKTKMGIFSALVLLGVSVTSQTVLMAQTTATGASTPKQVARAQRKAERKEARTKKNAELSKLEKNGYNPAGEQPNYPQNLQDAEKKAAGAKAASTAR